MNQIIKAGVVLALLLGLSAETARAQDAPLPYEQVVSANPFGLLLELFNAEYERVVTGSTTAGAGGSYADFGDPYVNADVFYRFYPQGRPLDGWAFGVKAGVTSFADDGAYVGLGFDVNRSWLLGERDNFYVGIGFGLKRLYGNEAPTPYIPTIRIINVGLAF